MQLMLARYTAADASQLETSTHTEQVLNDKSLPGQVIFVHGQVKR